MERIELFSQLLNPRTIDGPSRKALGNVVEPSGRKKVTRKGAGYQAQPLRRIYIPKKNGDRRPLGIPTLHDRAMQALYALGLNPIAETTGDKHSYGFREKRSLHDACKQGFIVLAQKTAAKCISSGITAKFAVVPILMTWPTATTIKREPRGSE